jgi:hypothetical protein
MWELKTARDLAPNRTFVVKGEYLASARKVTGPPADEGDTVTLPARALWARVTAEESMTLTPDQPVYILTCTCNGMSFIGRGWTFTGQCSCVHHPLPKES